MYIEKKLILTFCKEPDEYIKGYQFGDNLLNLGGGEGVILGQNISSRNFT